MKTLSIDGQKIAYRDEGQGPAVVFVHGTPSSSSEFVEVIDQLKSKFRCIAIDHLGFGVSDKPQNGDYSLQKHTERLRTLLDDHLNLKQFHLVVHDFGGVIGLPIAVENPDRVLSLTLMNTWAWPLEQTEVQMKKQQAFMTSWLMKFLYTYFNFSAQVLVKMAWGQYQPLTKDKHQRYKNAFQKPSERMGTVGFLKALFDSQNPAWRLQQKLSSLSQKPILLLWGAADPLITVKTLSNWQRTFPAARTVQLEKVGHFVSDEAPLLVAKHLNEHFETRR